MEKNTLTSFAMITFLMSSTAVVAMNTEEEARPNTAAGLTVRLQGTEEQGQPSSNISAAAEQKNGGWFQWPWFTSTPSVIPPAEEQQKDAPSTSSAALVDAHDKSLTLTPAVPALQLSTPEEFHMGKHNNYPTTGFSAFEGTHRWTLGEKASITIPLENMEPRPTSISFLNTKALVTGSHTQQLIVWVNGEEVKRTDYTLGNNNQTIEVSLPKDGDSATIEFESPKAISPSNLGISADKRTLGISFRGVQFQIPTPSVEETQQANRTIPSTAPAEGPGGSSASIGGISFATEDELVHRSQLLTPDQLEKLLQTARFSDSDPANLEDAKAMLSTPASTVSSETTPIPLTEENDGLLRRFFRTFFW